MHSTNTANRSMGKFYNRGFVVPFLWFAAIVSTAFTFYLQVTLNDPYMALLPYVFLGVTLIFDGSRFLNRSLTLIFRQIKVIDAWVLSFILLTLGKILLSNMLGASITEVGRNIFLFLMPVVAYFFIATTRNDRIIRAFLCAVAISGLIAGIFFAYESFSKFVLLEIPEFQLKANQYSRDRMVAIGNDAEYGNIARLSLQYRAQGLMTAHRATATWVAVGSFAALTLFVGSGLRRLRLLILLVGTSLLIVGLNFTSIMAFLLTCLLIINEGAVTMKRGQLFLSKTRLSRLMIATGFIVMFALFGATNTHPMVETIIDGITKQLRFIFMDHEALNVSYLELTLQNIREYLTNIVDYPLALLFGGIPITMEVYTSRGGDTGFLDSISIIGLPLYMAAVVGILLMVKKFWMLRKRIRSGQPVNESELANLQFAMATLLFILIMDGHYNVWMDKSVSILVFVALGLVRRHGYLFASATSQDFQGQVAA